LSAMNLSWQGPRYRDYSLFARITGEVVAVVGWEVDLNGLECFA
jgi:hypothetical protein